MDLGTAHSATGLLCLMRFRSVWRMPALPSLPPPHPEASASYHPSPPLERPAAGHKVLLRRADALQEREGALTEPLALVAELPPRVALLSGVAREVVELRLVVRAAQDQGALARCDGKRHVVGDPARFGVYGGYDLALRKVERPGAHDERPVLVSRPGEDLAERLPCHRGRQA